MAGQPFIWRDPRFTIADALTGARLVMLPYLIYGLARPLPGLAAVTLAGMMLTDLVDGRIARALGQGRAFGVAFDSTIDFVVIYGLFTTFLALGLLPWWKWAVIFFPALLMAWTQLEHVRRVKDVAFAPAFAGKVVGQIQMIYLPFLLLRRFWLLAPWARTADHLIFLLLAAAIVLNTIDYARTLRRIMALPPEGAGRG